jgi:hypothetical protein
MTLLYVVDKKDLVSKITTNEEVFNNRRILSEIELYPLKIYPFREDIE